MEDIKIFKPDVIIMDIDMPPSNGVEALKLLRKQYDTLPVIMLTVFEDNDNIINAICAGASGYLLKKDIEQLMPAIKDVLQGGAPMTSSVARKVLQLFPGKQEKKVNTESLTQRESEILNWLVKGYSYKMIATETNLNVETVRSHLKKIYRKLQVRSATEAVYKATQH
jgi:DNA-binding NarL/FixJ family response regulator